VLHSQPRRRFRIGLTAALASGVLAIVTLMWPDWIERVFGIEPDQGSGALEWVTVAVACAISVGSAVVARLEWRRARAAGEHA
jgi:hypothetical protein